jgi:hypothetical protein
MKIPFKQKYPQGKRGWGTWENKKKEKEISAEPC